MKTAMVCKLNRSLYGLKQSPHYWNNKFTKICKVTGFKESSADPCVFTRIYGTKKVEIIALMLMI